MPPSQFWRTAQTFVPSGESASIVKSATFAVFQSAPLFVLQKIVLSVAPQMLPSGATQISLPSRIAAPRYFVSHSSPAFVVEMMSWWSPPMPHTVCVSTAASPSRWSMLVMPPCVCCVHTAPPFVV
ncbi:MAG: hypothetical protein BWY59_00561 [Verrucomicrobia bacterium ADurb.Bin345]|nr:MAG: hypothetical protein BWY59_00561 [Verrucomicrobia bacterium ADurb.Bin345]